LLLVIDGKLGPAHDDVLSVHIGPEGHVGAFMVDDGKLAWRVVRRPPAP